MLNRFVEMEDVLRQLLEEKGWTDKIFRKRDSNDLRKQKLSNKDWKLMKNVIRVLHPFKTATAMLSSAQACISESIPTLTCLRKSLVVGSDDDGVIGLKQRLLNDLDERTKHYEERELYSIPTLLDCRYKNKFFSSDSSREKGEALLKGLLEREVSLLATDDEDEITNVPLVDMNRQSENNTLGDIFASVRNSANANVTNESSVSVESVLSGYLNSKLEEHNLAWWAKFSDSSRGCKVKSSLCKLAKKYLSAPPTSTETERLFSSAGRVIDNRHRLNPDTLEKLVVLRANLIMRNISIDW